MMDKKNFSFKVYPLNKEIERTWFVEIKNTDTGRIQKRYGNLRLCTTLADKEREAARIIADFQKLNGIDYSPRGHNKIIFELSETLKKIEVRLTNSSYHNYDSVFTRFVAWYREQYQKTGDIDPSGYIYMLQKKGYHKNYIRKQRNILQQIFKETGNWAGLKENPFKAVITKKIKSQSLLPYSRQQVEKMRTLIELQDAQLWMAIEFLFYLFFRPNELRYLKIKHILFDEMKVAVTADMLKDNDILQKAIPLQMYEKIKSLQDYPPDYYIFSKRGRPGPTMLSYNYLRAKHLKYRRAANLSERYGLYGWVHTGIKMAVLAGIPIKQLQLQKGHSDLKMFDEYLKNLGVEDCTALKNNFPEL